MVPNLDGGRKSFIIVSISQLSSSKSQTLFDFGDGSCTTLHGLFLRCCKGIYVEELKHETVREELIDSVIKELDESSEIKDNNFPENYQTCIHFYQPLQTMSQFGMK